MADETQRSADFVGRIVQDAKTPPETRMLSGWLGDATDEGYRRLYTDAELSGYVDIPAEAILYSEEIRDVQPSGGVLVWIRRDVEVRQGGSAYGRAARFLQGQVQQDFASASGGSGSASGRGESAGESGGAERAGFRCITKAPCGEVTGFTGECTRQPEVGGAWPCITAIPHCAEPTGFTGKCTHVAWPNPTRYIGCTVLHCPTLDLTCIPQICNIVASGIPGCAGGSPIEHGGQQRAQAAAAPEGGGERAETGGEAGGEPQAPATQLPGCGYTKSWGLCETHLLGCGFTKDWGPHCTQMPGCGFTKDWGPHCTHMPGCGWSRNPICTDLPGCHPPQTLPLCITQSETPRCGGGGEQLFGQAQPASQLCATNIACNVTVPPMCANALTWPMHCPSQTPRCPVALHTLDSPCFYNFAQPQGGGGAQQFDLRGQFVTKFGCPIISQQFVCTHFCTMIPQICQDTVYGLQCFDPQPGHGTQLPPHCPPPTSTGPNCPGFTLQGPECVPPGGKPHFAQAQNIGVHNTASGTFCTQFGPVCPQKSLGFTCTIVDPQCGLGTLFGPQCPPPFTAKAGCTHVPPCPPVHTATAGCTHLPPCPPPHSLGIACTIVAPQCQLTLFCAVQANAQPTPQQFAAAAPQQPQQPIGPTGYQGCTFYIGCPSLGIACTLSPDQCGGNTAATVCTQLPDHCPGTAATVCTRYGPHCPNPSWVDACPTRLCGGGGGAQQFAAQQQPIGPTGYQGCTFHIGCPSLGIACTQLPEQCSGGNTAATVCTQLPDHCPGTAATVCTRYGPHCPNPSWVDACPTRICGDTAATVCTQLADHCPGTAATVCTRYGPHCPNASWVDACPTRLCNAPGAWPTPQTRCFICPPRPEVNTFFPCTRFNCVTHFCA